MFPQTGTWGGPNFGGLYGNTEKLLPTPFHLIITFLINIVKIRVGENAYRHQSNGEHAEDFFLQNNFSTNLEIQTGSTRRQTLVRTELSESSTFIKKKYENFGRDRLMGFFEILISLNPPPLILKDFLNDFQWCMNGIIVNQNAIYSICSVATVRHTRIVKRVHALVFIQSESYAILPVKLSQFHIS